MLDPTINIQMTLGKAIILRELVLNCSISFFIYFWNWDHISNNKNICAYKSDYKCFDFVQNEGDCFSHP